MQYICKPKKLQIYVNKSKLTIDQIKAKLGCDAIINGGLYNAAFKPVCHLRVDGQQLATDPYEYYGYGWDTSDISMMSSKNEMHVRNFICCVALVRDGKALPDRELIYNPDMGGVRGRTAIGTKADGSLILYCAKDGSSEACTPETLRDHMFAFGCRDAIMLDGGRSSQCMCPSGMILSGRNVQNYIAVWEDKQPSVKRFIDVSDWQGSVNWDKVKGSIDGVILRAGCGTTYMDKQFTRNIKECNRLGIPVGAYLLSYARSVSAAKAEAEALLKAVKSYKMQLPLAFDYEYSSHKGFVVTRQLVSDMATAFCDTIANAGYTPINYTNIDYLTQYFTDEAAKKYGIWLAAWKSSEPLPTAKPPRDCVIWQYGVGRINGISTDVDMNYVYQDFMHPNGGVQPELQSVQQQKVDCPYAEPSANVKIGSIGTGAKWVQWYLNFVCGAKLSVDGVFGAASVKALMEFQTANGLIADGICGSATRMVLKDKAEQKFAEQEPPAQTEAPAAQADGCPYAEPAKNISYGNQGDSVRWLQWHLVKCGYQLTIDGDFGPSTRNALIAFQSANKLVADGICGKQTREALKAAASNNDSGGQNAYRQSLIVKRNQMLDYIEHRVGDLYVYGAQGEIADDKIVDWSARCFPSYTTSLRAQRMKRYLATHKFNAAGQPIRAVDCSGLFWAAENIYELPLVDGKDIDDATAAGLYYTYCKPIGKDQLQPLDLVFNTDLTHVGIVGRDGKIYEAAGSDIGVVCNDNVDVRRIKSIYGPDYGTSQYYTKSPWTKFGRLKIYAEAGL